MGNTDDLLEAFELHSPEEIRAAIAAAANAKAAIRGKHYRVADGNVSAVGAFCGVYARAAGGGRRAERSSARSDPVG
jgi:hypothetical protein